MKTLPNGSPNTMAMMMTKKIIARMVSTVLKMIERPLLLANISTSCARMTVLMAVTMTVWGKSVTGCVLLV